MPDPYLFSILLTLASGHARDVPEQFDQWERRLRNRVERLHVVPAEAQKVAPCDVVVTFAVDATGRPEEGQVRRSSCRRYYERKALGLVRVLGRIGPVPSSAGKDHRVVLKLSYGTEPDISADRRVSDSLASERRFWAGRNLAIVAPDAGWQVVSGGESAER